MKTNPRPKQQSSYTHSTNVPVTKRILYAVKDELQSEIRGLKAEVVGVKAEIGGVRAEVQGVKAEIEGVRAEVQGVKAEIEGVRAENRGVRAEVAEIKAEVQGVKADVRSLEGKMESRFENLKTDLHKMLVLMEEQNDRNRFVLDAYHDLSDRVRILESR